MRACPKHIHAAPHGPEPYKEGTNALTHTQRGKFRNCINVNHGGIPQLSGAQYAAVLLRSAWRGLAWTYHPRPVATCMMDLQLIFHLLSLQDTLTEF